MSEVYGEDRLATRAFFWRIERRDGVTLGFTSHDRDLMLLLPARPAHSTALF